ncbi:MAG: hypothetical protein Ct9H300mP25_01080 [Acidobacteriota bacterium]|nr:MAG: hypothetical protein Ct9H300mP25_01080 [Acidobacteriota bacterium]
MVDASGVTPQGDQFTGIQEYKELLLDQQLDQVARHLTTELLTFRRARKWNLPIVHPLSTSLQDFEIVAIRYGPSFATL